MINNRKEILKFLYELPKPYFSSIIKLNKSKIAGRGIIAQRTIHKGEILVAEQGPIINKKVLDKITSLTGYETNLCVGFNKYSIHAPLHKNYQGGYINHSCNPNAGLADKTTWIAIKKIKKGEEICCDYGTFETYPGWLMSCKCNSKNCRKMITSEDYKLPNLRKKLGKYFAPYLKQTFINLKQILTI